METIILGIIVSGGIVVGLLSPALIRRVSHRPANGELKTLERISKKVENIANHPAMKHSSIFVQR